jgi:hypothetical protein
MNYLSNSSDCQDSWKPHPKSPRPELSFDHMKEPDIQDSDIEPVSPQLWPTSSLGKRSIPEFCQNPIESTRPGSNNCIELSCQQVLDQESMVFVYCPGITSLNMNAVP